MRFYRKSAEGSEALSKVIVVERPEECPYREVDNMSRHDEHVCVRSFEGEDSDWDRSCDDLVDFPLFCPLEDRDGETGLEYE